MTELKTLKDLLNEKRYDVDKEIKLDAVLVDDLEQELIKHINHLENEAKENKEVFLRNAAISGWIINFGNFTEKDLK